MSIYKSGLIASSSATYVDNIVGAITPTTVRQLNDLWIEASVMQGDFDNYTGSVDSTFAGTASLATSASFAATASFVSGTVDSSSYALTASHLDATDLFISGNLTVIGTASFQYIHTVIESASVIYSSGSNQFGDNTDDTQSLFGTVTISGSLEVTGALNADLNGTASYALTASFVSGTIATASYALTASVAETASLAFTASYLSGSAETASFAITASYLSGSAETASYAFTSSVAFTSSLSITSSYALTASFVSTSIYSRETHVSVGVGSDVTGDGTFLRPYKTIGKGLAKVTSGEQLIVHPGTYPENITISGSANNFTLVGANTETSGIVYISGSINVPQTISSVRITGISANTINHTGACNLYLQNSRVLASLTKSSTGYFEVFKSSTEFPTTTTITGTGTSLFINSFVGPTTVNNAAAVVAFNNCGTVVQPTVTAGTLFVEGGTVYAFTSGSAAINSSAGTVVALKNTQVLNPNTTVARVAIGGFFSVDDANYDKRASTVGTSLNTVAHFQTIEATNLSGSLFGTASQALTASFLSGSVATASFAFTASQAFTSSLALTASFLSGSVATASYALTASVLESTASYAYTASYLSGSVETASFALTASVLEGTASYAYTASYVSGSVTTASFALTASYLEGTASWAIQALTSSLSYTSSLSDTSSFSFTASIAESASLSVSSSYSETAQTASYVMFANLIEADDDTDAASKGVPVNGIYANGNFILRRIS